MYNVLFVVGFVFWMEVGDVPDAVVACGKGSLKSEEKILVICVVNQSINQSINQTISY